MHDDDQDEHRHMAAWDDDSGGYTISEASGRVLGALAALGVVFIIFSLVGLILMGWGRI